MGNKLTVEQAATERAELKKSLREIKSDLARKDEQLSDLQEEFVALREASKERERTLKAKVKEAVAERDRLVGVEVNLMNPARSTPTNRS